MPQNGMHTSDRIWGHMENVTLFHKTYWEPLRMLGFTGNFWRLNAQTIMFTWAALGILALLIVGARHALKKRHSIGEFLILSSTNALKNLVVQSLGTFNFNHFAFIASLFTFILLCNLLPLIPWFEEPTSDLCTTLGLGLASFFYIQGSSISAHGFLGYLKEFTEPFLFMLPMEIVGKLATIVSISFRLFGNIMGGSIISKLFLHAIGGFWLRELLGIALGLNMLIALFFVVFEGLIQAFVFAMLSLTYLALAIKKEE